MLRNSDLLLWSQVNPISIHIKAPQRGKCIFKNTINYSHHSLLTCLHIKFFWIKTNIPKAKIRHVIGMISLKNTKNVGLVIIFLLLFEAWWDLTFPGSYSTSCQSFFTPLVTSKKEKSPLTLGRWLCFLFHKMDSGTVLLPPCSPGFLVSLPIKTLTLLWGPPHPDLI